MTIKQKNIIFPLLIVVFICVLAVLLGYTPLSLIIFPIVLIVFLVYCNLKEKGVKKMFLYGGIITIVYILLLMFMSYLARNNSIIEKIMSFPIK